MVKPRTIKPPKGKDVKLHDAELAAGKNVKCTTTWKNSWANAQSFLTFTHSIIQQQ